MDDCLGYVFIIGIVLAILYIIVVYVIPVLLGLAVAVIAVFAAIGILVGLGFSIRNYSVSISDVSYDRRSLGYFRDSESASKAGMVAYDGNEQNPSKVDYSGFVYEDLARKIYFLGPCFRDVKDIIVGAFEENFTSIPDFSRGEVWWSRVLFFAWSLCQLIAQWVFGTIITLALSCIIAAFSFVLAVLVYVVFGIILLSQNIYFKIKGIEFRCQKCTHSYDVPYYECPQCGVKHERLKPGKYGIFKRKCLCGAVLPLTVNGSGTAYIYNPEKSATVWTTIKMTDLKSYCPHCGNEDNAGLTHPISIALIGGSSAGKTTFKTAFLKDFIDEELTKYDIDYTFPNNEYETEFRQIESYYRGIPIPPTPRGTEYDIITFSFALKHKKFGTDRLIHLYDMPGESFQNGDAQEGWNMYTFNDGAVFLIDPYSLPKIKEMSSNEIKGSVMGISEMSMNTLVESLIETLRQVKTPKNKKNKFTIPIALTINKADSQMLKRLIGKDGVNKLLKNHPEVFNDYYDAMDYLCRCFLAENGYSGFISNLDMNFETVHFFSSSPMGAVPKGARTPFYPVNVLPIMQWLMLRTDNKLAAVWTPENEIKDVSDEDKNRYKKDPSYYNEIAQDVMNI